MSEHRATITWRSDGSAFTDQRYSRRHVWSFDGGIDVPASSSPHVVPEPMSIAAAVDPEEAFVASLASCHMLWFLSIAAERGYRVESYEDAAVGVMGKDADGRTAVTVVCLHPRVRFSSANPAADILKSLHDAAHHSCFLAASVRSEVRCQPRE